MTMYELIKTLTELPGPGGDEWHVQALAERTLAAIVSER